MRHAKLVSALLCILTLGTIGYGAGGGSDIPRDDARARQEAFFRKNIIDAYETVGLRDPKWDANARRVLALAVQRWMTREPGADLDWQIVYYADKALDAGCEDPMVLYHGMRAHMRTGATFRSGLPISLNRTIHVCKYEPFLKVFALARLAEYAKYLTTDTDSAPLAMKLLGEAVDNLPALMSERDFPQDLIPDLCVDLTDDSRAWEGDRKPMIDKIYGVMLTAQPHSGLAELFKGAAYTNYAWDARGASFAADVTNTGWRLFAERLATAKEACNAALDKSPSLAEAAAQMLGVQLGEDVARGEMEQYFQLAIAGDPDCYDAYDKKLYYLTPKWHGTMEDQLAFGRQCLATKRWDSRIPFLVLQSHTNMAEGRMREICTDMDNEVARKKAWQQAEGEMYTANPSMWKDVQDLYEGYIAHNPDAVTDRLDYAENAMTAGQLDVAIKQMLAVSANTDPAYHDLLWRHDQPRKSVDTALSRRIWQRQARGQSNDALHDLRDLGKLIWSANPQQLYCHLWIWMVQEELGDKTTADHELAEFVKTRPPAEQKGWSCKIAALFLGKLSEADFLAAAAASNPKDRQGNQCEAWYYAGKKRLLAGDRKTAADDFDKCIATNMTDFVEYQMAQLELESLGRQPR